MDGKLPPQTKEPIFIEKVNTRRIRTITLALSAIGVAVALVNLAVLSQDHSFTGVFTALSIFSVVVSSIVFCLTVRPTSSNQRVALAIAAVSLIVALGVLVMIIAVEVALVGLHQIH